MRVIAAALLFLVLQSTPTELDGVVQRASVYSRDYMRELGSMIGEERYRQEADWEDFYELNPQNPQGKTIHSHRSRQITSDFLTLPVGNSWPGVRQVRDVDGVTLDPAHRGAVREGFDESTTLGRRQLQQSVIFENARYNIGDIGRSANLPTFPLDLLDAGSIGRLKFSKTGEERIESVATWKIRFTQQNNAAFSMGSGVGPNRQVSLSGTLWIEPVTGRVFRAEIEFLDPQRETPEGRKKAFAARMDVRFKLDPDLDILVPAVMEEQYGEHYGSGVNGLDLHHEVRGHADYANFRRFQSSVRFLDLPEKDSEPTPGDETTLKVNARLVNVEASVTDSNGRSLTDLQAGDFSILENNIPQSITNFSPVSMPYDVLLLFDRSGSTQKDWTLMQKAPQGFIANLRPQDRAGIANFDSSLRMLTRWTDTRQQVAKVVSGMTSGKPPGGTAFYKAATQSIAAELLPVEGRRRALVILTDGQDNGLLYDIVAVQRSVPEMRKEPAFVQMLELARRERIPIYVVAITTASSSVQDLRKYSGALANEYLSGVRTRLEALAEVSGG